MFYSLNIIELTARAFETLPTRQGRDENKNCLSGPLKIGSEKQFEANPAATSFSSTRNSRPETVFAVVMATQTVARWNQIITWLGEVNIMREATAACGV
ncbi:MAG: hypothetical protein NTX71_11865 [Candidatus Aureabacteria bacterium]|nr:hypothetical protein [Candidatus Auribacterota bacterium]